MTAALIAYAVAGFFMARFAYQLSKAHLEEPERQRRRQLVFPNDAQKQARADRAALLVVVVAFFVAWPVLAFLAYRQHRKRKRS